MSDWIWFGEQKGEKIYVDLSGWFYGRRLIKYQWKYQQKIWAMEKIEKQLRLSEVSHSRYKWWRERRDKR